MKILLAGPGTGKTTNIKNIIQEKGNLDSILVISFTNATVEDLKKSLSPIGLPETNCMTLHKFAVKYNHDKSRHVLDTLEIDLIKQIAKRISINFNDLCNFFSATTFDQMIDRFVDFAKSNPEYLKDKLSNFSTLIVDEYQDFNKNEQALIDLLTEIIDESFILGDDDQCIYDFKDADNEKIISLYLDKSHEKINHEHKCYRCPDVIVDSAGKLIKNNKKRVIKKWEKTGKPGALFQKQFLLNDDANNYIINSIKEIVNNSSEEKILILSPVKFLIEKLSNLLENASIDHKNYFVSKVDPEILKKAWVLRILFGEHKYLNLVLTGYNIVSPRKKLYELIKKHFDSGQDIAELSNLILPKLPDEARIQYENIEGALEGIYFHELTDCYNDANGNNVGEKLENLFVLIGENAEKQVNIMSIHKSKGLGADHVFMVGLVEGIIPNRGKGNDTIESQRRLFYVGMTRAKTNLHLISNIKIEGKYVNRYVNKDDFKFDIPSKLWKGKASRFIEEINSV